MATQNQDKDAIISALTKRVKDLEADNDECKSLRDKIKRMKAELVSSKEMNKSMQKVCAYMTRVATDGTKQRGKGIAGVMELAEKSVRGCLQEHAIFVSETVWPTVKRMPDHWTAFSTKKTA